MNQSACSYPVVLIVEDEAAAREGLKLALADEEVSILTARNGKEALQILEDSSVSLVLTDLKMPEMNGLELLKRIKSEYEDISVIMITGFATIDSAVEAMKEGALEYIRKPYELDAVRRTVRQALERCKLAAENKILKKELADSTISNKLICKSNKMKAVIELIEKIAPSGSNVLISGESGTGKELVARTIHNKSSAARSLFIPFNCAARAESLIESELFGYEKGAFTGADKRRKGVFEACENGTVFLDEIGEISLSLQVKLLRVVQERELIRLGGNHPVKVNFRLLCATNRVLEDEVKKGNFREDLFYRLNVFSIHVPPLRERKEDILELADEFVSRLKFREGRNGGRLSAIVKDYLISYEWPGNVRELQNVIERAVILSTGDLIQIEDLYFGGNERKSLESEKKALLSLASNEKRYILEVMDQVDGNQSRAARILEMDRSSLWRKLKLYKDSDE
jgi:DNA-binding NtrC family response regulator